MQVLRYDVSGVFIVISRKPYEIGFIRSTSIAYPNWSNPIKTEYMGFQCRLLVEPDLNDMASASVWLYVPSNTHQWLEASTYCALIYSRPYFYHYQMRC